MAGPLPFEPYVSMIESFLGCSFTAVEFERSYRDRYLEDPTLWDKEVFRILDTLFGEVDAFCADPSLRDADDLDEKGLRAAATVALKQLQTRYDW